MKKRRRKQRQLREFPQLALAVDGVLAAVGALLRAPREITNVDALGDGWHETPRRRR